MTESQRNNVAVFVDQNTAGIRQAARICAMLNHLIYQSGNSKNQKKFQDFYNGTVIKFDDSDKYEEFLNSFSKLFSPEAKKHVSIRME